MTLLLLLGGVERSHLRAGDLKYDIKTIKGNRNCSPRLNGGVGPGSAALGASVGGALVG